MTKVITGYMPGLTISSIIHNQEKVVLSFSYVVITRINGDRNVSELKNISDDLERMDCVFENLGVGLKVVFDRNVIKYIINIFSGFNELWFYDTEPILSNQPPCISTELALKNTEEGFKERLHELQNWMQTSGCTLGMGDGCGVNVVTVDPVWVLSFSSESSLIEDDEN